MNFIDAILNTNTRNKPPNQIISQLSKQPNNQPTVTALFIWWSDVTNSRWKLNRIAFSTSLYSQTGLTTLAAVFSTFIGLNWGTLHDIFSSPKKRNYDDCNKCLLRPPFFCPRCCSMIPSETLQPKDHLVQFGAWSAIMCQKTHIHTEGNQSLATR